MSKIYFKQNKEVIYFCEMMFQYRKEVNLKWRQSKRWGNELLVNEVEVSKEELVKCLTAVFIHYRLQEMIEHVVVKRYFYTEDLEVEKICELTNKVLGELAYGAKLFDEHENLETYIGNLFTKTITNNEKVYYDSIKTFCTQSLKECLLEAVAYAIDEHKREEEYQSFIQSVRVYIENRPVKMNELYILQGAYFTFYDKLGKRYSNEVLRELMADEPLYMIGLDQNELNLAPIITLSPRKIFLYGTNPADAKTLSIINLFEERVEFLPRNKFPFEAQIMSALNNKSD